MNPLDELSNKVPDIETKLGYTFRDKKLLTVAFIHCSFINEFRDTPIEPNERLEFLGDSVLNLIIAEHLYRILPSTPEGELSNLRSRLVEASACFAYMCKLDVAHHLLLGKGERLNDGRGRESILADLFEAVVGAIYLDGGLDVTRQYLFSHFREEIETILKRPVRNWKAVLQDFAQKKFQHAPQYKVLEELGPDHHKNFLIAVYINEEEWGQGRGASKKEAQQNAAAEALQRLGITTP